MNNVWEFAHWTASEQWQCALRLRFTSLSLLAVTLILLAGGFFVWDCRRRESALDDRARALLLGVNIFSLLLLWTAADVLTFYCAWWILMLSQIVLNPRDSKADGITLSTIRWAPGQISTVALLAVVVLLHGLFHTTDWSEMVQLLSEPVEYAPWRGGAVLGASALAAWLPFFFAPARRADLWTGFQFWSRNVAAPVAAFALLHRVHFLTFTHPHGAAALVIALFLCAATKVVWPIARPYHRHSLTAFGVGVGAWFCALVLAWGNSEPWVLRVGILSTVCVVVAAVRLGSNAWKWNAPEATPVRTPILPGWWDRCATALRGFDRSFWDALWQVPVRFTHSLGGAFVYWQGNSAQYTLVVILIGTLVLFWAALKTQVIW